VRYKNLSYLNKKRPRYIRQRDRYSCGVIAVINLLKYLGEGWFYRDHKLIKEWIGCTKNGTPPRSIEYALLSFIKWGAVKNFTVYMPVKLENLDNALQNNRPILFCSFYKRNDRVVGHYALIVKKTNKGYICVNFYKGHTLSFISRSQMIEILKIKGTHGDSAYGWEIEPSNLQ
jgi:hypothetical protein